MNNSSRGNNWIDDLVKASPLRSQIGFKGLLEFMGASESDQAGRTVTFRIRRTAADTGAAHPFSAFTRRRGKIAGTIFEAAVTSVATGELVYSDELMLANWSDGPQGATVKLWCSEGGDRHPFLGYTRPSKGAAGSEFAAVLLQKDDDEQIVNQEKVERQEAAVRTGRREQTLSNAVMLVLKNPRFHDWLGEFIGADWSGKPWDAKAADEWLKFVLEIESKRELDDDKNQAAIVGWNKIRLRFVAWQEEQGTYDPRHPEM